MNKQMSSEELKENIIDFLKENKQASLATSMGNIPRSSPVQYFMGNGTDIYIISAGGSKFENIKENLNVCMLVNTEYINYRRIKGVQVFGKATTSEQKNSLLDEAKKYLPDSYLLEHENSNLKVIKIIPEEIVYLDSLENGERTKQILKSDIIVIKEDK